MPNTQYAPNAKQLELSKNALIHSSTHHSNPCMVFKNKHYWPYAKYNNIYLNYK